MTIDSKMTERTLKLRPKVIIDEEVKWEKKKTIISKTDIHGTITYANNVFSNTCEYSKLELIGEPHNIIRHPDMPKVAFKALWDALNQGKNYHAIVKNLTKTGRYYWVITDFTIDKDRAGNVTGYTARRKSVPKGVVEKVEPIYKLLLDIEKEKGAEASAAYFVNFLKEEVGKSYEDFVIDLFHEEKQKETKKGFFSSFKKTMDWFFYTDYEN